MTLPGFFTRFTLAYIALLIILSTVLYFLGIQSSTAGGIAALLGAVLGCCLWFGHANQRFFTKQEKRVAIFGMLAIDVTLQCLVLASLVLLQIGGISAPALVFGILLASTLHLIAIWVMVNTAEKQLPKILAANKG